MSTAMSNTEARDMIRRLIKRAFLNGGMEVFWPNMFRDFMSEENAVAALLMLTDGGDLTGMANFSVDGGQENVLSAKFQSREEFSHLVTIGFDTYGDDLMAQVTFTMTEVRKNELTGAWKGEEGPSYEYKDGTFSKKPS